MWKVSPGGCLEYFQTNQSFLFSQDNQNLNTQWSLLRIGPEALKETPERVIVWGAMEQILAWAGGKGDKGGLGGRDWTGCLSNS